MYFVWNYSATLLYIALPNPCMTSPVYIGDGMSVW